MRIREFIREIPKLPLTALIFFLIAFLLWSIGIIPPPSKIVVFLEGLYNRYGLGGLFISAFLEGIVYLGLYLPGSFIIALAVFSSDGSFFSLIAISIVVAIALTLTSFINYFLGRYIFLRGLNNKKRLETSRKSSKGLFLSMLHPNILAFYFFNEGLEKKAYWKIIFVPIIMIPYGFLGGLLLSSFRIVLRDALENPYFIMFLILIWLEVAFIIEYKRKLRKA